MHSRIWVDQALRGLMDFDAGSEEDEEHFQTSVAALQLWHSKVTYCTAHTVLGFLQNHRKGLYGFPALAQGIFVFDEIHAYPPVLFANLLQFLKIFTGNRIALMSGSLPPNRLERLKGVVEEALPIEGDPVLEEIPRYKIEFTTPKQAWEAIKQELTQGEGKILWICNRVREAQLILLEALQELPPSLVKYCFHSRFRYEDSVTQQTSLVSAFRSDQPVFAVTTQIAEMSLDISASLLITANAPLWALIQRFGRLNRWVDLSTGALMSGRICKALIYPSLPKPYLKDELSTGDLLKSLEGKNVSQKSLASLLQEVDEKFSCECSVEALKSWQTKPGYLMPPNQTVQGILKADLPRIEASKTPPLLECQKYALSVRPLEGKTWRKFKPCKYLRIFPEEDIFYSARIGAVELDGKPESKLLEAYFSSAL